MYELNKCCNESNYIPSETNKSEYSNAILPNPIYHENNTKNRPNLDAQVKKEKTQKINLRLISSFVFLCATATLVTGIYIPVFSEVFTPPPVEESKVIEPTFTFSSVSATDSKISFMLKSENLDLTKDKVYLYTVKQSDASTEYFASIPQSIKLREGVPLKNETDIYSFNRCITTTGGVAIMPETEYSVLVVKDDKIVDKLNVTTAKKVYLSEINVYFDKEHINITLKPDTSFVGFGTLLIQVKNLTISTWGAEHNGIDRTTGSEADIAKSRFIFPVSPSKIDQYFEVKIYCVTTDPEKKALPDTIKYGDDINPEYYYLIYTYDKPIVLKGV